MNYTVEKTEAFTVIGFERLFSFETSYKEIPDFWTEMYKIHAPNILAGKGPKTEVEHAIMENYIDVRLAPNLESTVSNTFSLYETLEKKYNIHIDSSIDTIGAKTAEFIEAQLLDIKVGAALLDIRRIELSGGKPVSYSKTLLRADRYQLEITTSGSRYF